MPSNCWVRDKFLGVPKLLTQPQSSRPQPILVELNWPALLCSLPLACVSPCFRRTDSTLPSVTDTSCPISPLIKPIFCLAISQIQEGRAHVH